MGRNVAQICIKLFLSHLLKAVKAIGLEKESVIDMPSLGTAC